MPYNTPDFIIDPKQREVFVRLVTRGFTVRGLRKQMAVNGVPISTDLPDAVIINWMRSVRGDLETVRAEADQDFPFFYGMASAYERARRLIELAEDIESKAHTDTDWTNMYRQLLAQIKQELEPFSLTIKPGDGWADLMERLINASTKVDEGDLDPTDVDSGYGPEINGAFAQS